MKKIATLASATTLLAMLPHAAIATTCSCAGVPILGAMQSASPNDNQWFLASTYEFHDLSDLVSGSSSVPDQTGRDRTSQALILEASKGLSEHWSFSALLSAVEHERDISGVKDSASGLGDAILMAKYSPKTISLYSKNSLSFGIGSRLPIGEDDASSQGITLAEDLQPSTGAYGGIAWAYAAHAFNDSTSLRLYGMASYTYNDENDRDYQFGHATTVSIGTSYQTQSPWGFNFELAYRHAERDQRNSVDIPNTGGNWLDVIPAVQYHINDTLALKASAKIPVSRDLNDQLQFTTKYAIRISLSYVFGE
ncbi:MAG: hypothetical protein OES10_12565 [Gammaproteobacteria bacterium]|nr:hypothetical protein [Gammaproteobacteria bacterium]MDH3749623.1 hypothetical protein [Gammaproteobacteria bacterium]